MCVGEGDESNADWHGAKALFLHICIPDTSSFPHALHPAQLATLLHGALEANASNWGALQMAGLYWRAVGDAPNVGLGSTCSGGPRLRLPLSLPHHPTPPASCATLQAVACYRRAFVNAPINYKDMALIGLANTLQLADEAVDAITLAQMAIQISPRNPTNHLMMGNLLVVIDEQTDEASGEGGRG